MNKFGVLAYLLVLLFILYPVLNSWDDAISLEQKKSMLPPAMPEIKPNKNNYLESLLARNLWARGGDEVEKESLALAAHHANAESQEAHQWELKGIGSLLADELVAVIALGDEVKTYRKGDGLPDGAELIAVDVHSITTEKSGEKARVYLFRAKP